MRNDVRRTEPRRSKPQGSTGTLATLRAEKGGDQTGELEAETSSRLRYARANRDLGSRSREARNLAQGREVDSDGSGHL